MRLGGLWRVAEGRRGGGGINGWCGGVVKTAKAMNIDLRDIT